jgi:Protochlamydia outer membrane protein
MLFSEADNKFLISRGIMRKLMAVLAGCAMLSGQPLLAGFCDLFNGNGGCFGCRDWPSSGNICEFEWPCFKLDLGGGYRNDRFQWSIAGIDNFPNTLSQLNWHDLRIAQAGGNAYFVSCRNYVLYAAAEAGRIYHGHVTDTDYLLDDKQGLFSKVRADAGRGHVYDLKVAGGYRVQSTCGRFIGFFLAGYSQYAQYLHMYDGHQLSLFDFTPCNDPIPGLNSKYTTLWYGPWAGIDFEARVEPCAFLFGGVEWHMFAYRGHGFWNLRTDFVKRRFDHKAVPAWGYVIRLGGKWEIWPRWSLGVVGYFRMFRTKNGHEHLCLNDPEFGPTRVKLRFNGAQWHGYAVSGIVSWRF